MRLLGEQLGKRYDGAVAEHDPIVLRGWRPSAFCSWWAVDALLSVDHTVSIGKHCALRTALKRLAANPVWGDARREVSEPAHRLVGSGMMIDPCTRRVPQILIR